MGEVGGCDQEVSNLTLIETCPTDNTKFLLIGVPFLISPSNPGGYGLIEWSQLILCLNSGSPSYYATLDGAETDSLLNADGEIFTIQEGAVGVLKITIWAHSNLDENVTIQVIGQADNTGDVITWIEADRLNVGGIPYGYDWWQDPSLGGSVLVSGDQSFKGIRVTITGIAGKTLNCEAQFEFKRQTTF